MHFTISQSGCKHENVKDGGGEVGGVQGRIVGGGGLEAAD